MKSKGMSADMKKRPSSASGGRVTGYNLNPPYGRTGSKQPRRPKGKKSE